MVPNGQNVKSGDVLLTDGHERARNFLSDGEMDALLEASKKGRHGVRDFLILLRMFRHGLRVSEAVRMRRQDLNLKRARVWIRRLKNGLSVDHPIAGDELRAIKRYLHTRHDALPWLFASERGQPMTRQSVNYLIGAAARRAALGALHPHMLRHSCGFYLANQGYDPEADPGLPRAPRPQAHGSLYAGRWRPVRGDVGDVRHGRGRALSGEHHQFGTSEQLCCYWA